MITSVFKSSFSIVLIVSASFVFYACNKSSDSSFNPSDNQFQWTYSGVAHTTTYDTAFLTSHGLGIIPISIIAGFQGPSNVISRRVEFNLTSFNTGIYSIGPSPSSPNRLSFIDDAGFNLNGVSGSLNITSNSNNYLTGNFTTTVSNGSGVTSELTGSFANMSIVN